MKRMNRLSARLLAVALAACSGSAALANEPVQPVSGYEVAPTTIADYSDAASQPSSSLLSAPQYIQQQRAANYSPRMYFQTEATFLSRRYDRPETRFALFNTNSTFSADTDVDGNFEFVEWSVSGLTDPTSRLEPSHELADQLTAAPRLALGVVGEGGWGIQGRYWRMENSVGGFDPLIGSFDYSTGVADDDVNSDWFDGELSQTSDFERFNVQTIDLEGSKDFSFYAWRGLATFGARYADLNNVRYSTVDGAIRTGSPGIAGGSQDTMNNSYHTADYDFSALQTMNFHGVGPTFSLTGFRSLTDNFGLFTSARGSVLFGDSRNVARVDGQMSSLFDDVGATDLGVITSTEELFIAELQLGGQWSRPVRFINGQFFVRGAFEYQFWRNSTARASAAIDDGTVGDWGDAHTIINNDIESGIGTTEGSGFAFGLEPDFDLIGFSLSTGFVW